MQLQKFRWSKVYESQEEELLSLLNSRGLIGTRWVVNAYHDGKETITQDTTLWSADGSLNVIVDGKSYSIQPGDALNLPAGTPIAIRTELFGSVCYRTSS